MQKSKGDQLSKTKASNITLFTRIIIFLLVSSLPINKSLAQVYPDQSLGAEASMVQHSSNVNNMPIHVIEGGAIRGENLFHSFDVFHVRDNQKVYFSNPSGVNLIFSRVTGNQSSQILGTLGVQGQADLFFVNPQGIFFGPRSTLDLQGSFLATTAESLVFEDGFKFSSKIYSPQDLLTIAVPNGLQFGAAPGSIINQSISPDSNGQLIGLQVQTGRTLALLGGNILHQGGSLTARGGRIEVGSLAGNNSVDLLQIENGWAVNYRHDIQFQDIQLGEAPQFIMGAGTLVIPSIVNITSEGMDASGLLRFQGKNIILREGTQILGTGADLIFSASDTVEISGVSASLFIPSLIISAAPLAGREGSITINTRNLLIKDGGLISAGSTAIEIGDQTLLPTISGGTVTVRARDSIELLGGPNGRSSIVSSTNSSGDAGDILLSAQTLILRDQAIISVNSSTIDEFTVTGAAGNISIEAHSISLENQSTLTAETATTEGNIFLQAQSTFLSGQSQITTDAREDASGGDITINSSIIVGQGNSDITANATQGSGGQVLLSASGGIIGFIRRTLADLEAVPGRDPAELPTSDVSAISQLGGPSLAGAVIFQTPETDPSDGLIDLPLNRIDPSKLIAQRCVSQNSESAKLSELFISQRGGVAPSPTDALFSNNVHTGWVVLAPEADSTKPVSDQYHSLTPVAKYQDTQIVEAQGWQRRPNGKLMLTATSQRASTHLAGLHSGNCQG